jgi:hypothetical protein
MNPDDAVEQMPNGNRVIIFPDDVQRRIEQELNLRLAAPPPF